MASLATYRMLLSTAVKLAASPSLTLLFTHAANVARVTQNFMHFTHIFTYLMVYILFITYWRSQLWHGYETVCVLQWENNFQTNKSWVKPVIMCISDQQHQVPCGECPWTENRERVGCNFPSLCNSKQPLGCPKACCLQATVESRQHFLSLWLTQTQAHAE